MAFSLKILVSGIVAVLAVASLVGAAPVTLEKVLAATDWLNGRPSAPAIRGKVVLLDFYTFDCYNCKNTEPNLRALYRSKSRMDLVILGVHSPETEMERNRNNLIESLKEQGIVWPVAVDNDFALWQAYGVNAWPTQMIFTRAGTLAKVIVGDSQDQAVDAEIDRLIAQKT
jgi:thiol-disulfide isomerase/thioredoxin